VAEDLNVLTVGVRDIQLPANPTSSFSAITQKTSSLKFLPTIQMLVEVMQRVDPGDDFMAMAELIALDLAADGTSDRLELEVAQRAGGYGFHELIERFCGERRARP
jgi:hypothetical protein